MDSKTTTYTFTDELGGVARVEIPNEWRYIQFHFGTHGIFVSEARDQEDHEGYEVFGGWEKVVNRPGHAIRILKGENRL